MRPLARELVRAALVSAMWLSTPVSQADVTRPPEGTGERCGPMCGRGDITVALPDGERPFLSVSWWVS